MADTIAEILRARADDDRPALAFEDSTWTYRSFVSECARRAALIHSIAPPPPAAGPSDTPSPAKRRGFHIGILADNIPEFPFWLGGAALAGATVVGINPTRRGAELARDITHTECSLILTEDAYEPMIADLDLGAAAPRVLRVDSGEYARTLDSFTGATLDEVDAGAEPSDLFLLIFTSGTSAAPKAVLCSQGRLARIGSIVAMMFEITGDDVCYQAMPMFHSNALMAGWCPALAAGATFAMRRKFSASGFVEDVRHFGATYFNYVGKTLSYILATEPSPDDTDNTLARGFGNEGTRRDVEEFSARFGCVVTDAYGSTEGGAVVSASPDTPPGALGPCPEGTVVLDPATGERCPPALFDSDGHLLNAEEATGEMVNTFGVASFEGYWRNDDATAERIRDGYYWTGDLAYVDAAGFIYFAGRSYDWLRVDGENFAAAPIERILARHADVVLAAVYAVPDSFVGDQVMAALQLRPGARFDPGGFAAFLADQGDLGTKWAPRYVRIADALPATQSHKVLKRPLRSERWECADPVWWRPGKEGPYLELDAAAISSLRAEFAQRGRLGELGG